MLKRRCHNKGQAIRISNGLIMICSCITNREIEMVIDEAKFRARKSGLPKPRLPKGHQPVNMVDHNANI